MEALNILQPCYRLLTPHVLILKIFPDFCAKIQLDQNTITRTKGRSRRFLKMVEACGNEKRRDRPLVAFICSDQAEF